MSADRVGFNQDDRGNTIGQESVSARERAYRSLRQRLITLDLAPGSVIDVSRLVRENAVGTTPIREAIQRLAVDDLLTIHPRRGTVVTEPSVSQARHILEVRDAFEGRAARLASQRALGQDLLEMRHLVELQLAERDQENYAQFLQHDYLFHMHIARVSGNPMLVRAIDHLLALNVRLWFVFFRIQGPRAQFMLSHEPILQAIEARDLDAAEAAAVSHVRESNTLLLSMFHEVQVRGTSADTLSGPDRLDGLRAGAKTGD